MGWAMNLAGALRYLFPNADPIRDYEIRDEGQGAFIAEWRLAAAQPTAAELQAASDAYDAAQAQAESEAAALRIKVRTVAQSAVGVLITDLTAAQVRALLAVLLWKAGALDKDGKVRALNDWV